VIAVIATISVLGMVALNTRLAGENRRLAQALAEAEAARMGSLELPAGTTVPELIGRSFTGEERRIAFGRGAQKTLLLVFSSTCPVCERNWPQWKTIIDAVDGSGVRIVAVDLPSHAPPGYLSRHGAREEWLLRDLDPKLFVAYRFSLVPQAIVIDGAGRVEDVRTGSLDASDVSRLIETITEGIS
jgi:hypothetical protein